MLNEYTYIIIELILSILCLLICKSLINKNTYTWKTLCMKCLYFLWCILLMVLYVFEYYSNYLIIRYLSLFIIMLFIFILFINIMNFIFSIFMERKHKRIHFILNYVSYLSDLNIKRCYEINRILEICFHYLMLFSLGSIVLSFITSYYFDSNNIVPNIYLLEIGPHFILFFIVLALSVWCLSMFTTLVYHKCCNAHIKDEHEDKIIDSLNQRSCEW